MSVCVINQPAGLGDIFYSQKIAKEILKCNKANKIIWPVLDHFIYLKNYLEYNGIEYIEQSKFTIPKDSIEVNLHTADHRYSGSVMSPPNSLKHNIPYYGNKDIVDINFYPDVNLFDWCRILEDASEIHLVETSFIYILEKLNLKSKNNLLYSRFKPANFTHIKHIPQNINWKYKQW